MTDRERLIELIKQGNIDYLWSTGKAHYTFLADYLLANGVIVPPCKVGQKVYTKGHGNAKQLKEWEVFGIWNSLDPEYSYIHICWHKNNNNFGARQIGFDEIGKTVFLTKEEAEAKLKESKGNGNR
jgi:hypothetical protein